MQTPSKKDKLASRWAKGFLKVVLVILVARILFTFVFAFASGEQWHFEYIWNFLPIIAFNSETVIFTKINSYSLLSTTAILFIFFLESLFLRKKVNYHKTLVTVWLLGVWLTLFQFLIALFVNRYFRFSADPKMWLPITALAVLATIIFFWKRKKLAD